MLIPVHAANLMAGSLGLGGGGGAVALSEIEGLSRCGIPETVLARVATDLVPDLEKLVAGLG